MNTPMLCSVEISADLAIKSAIILATAWLAMLLMRRASAATRHLVWVLAVAATLALPLLCGLLPQWRVLPAWIGRDDSAETSPRPQANPIAPVSVMPANDSGLRNNTFPPSLDLRRPQTHDTGSTSSIASPPPVQIQPPRVTKSPVVPPQRTVKTLQRWAAMAWALGSGILALPILISLGSLWLLGRRLPRIEGGSWMRLCRDLSADLRLTRPVTLLRGKPRAMPMTWGLFRPKLVLPPEADAWPAQRRRVVLMHELAHIKRGDFAVQLLVHLARAAYWFNPLMWVATKQIALESEGACDDLVLASETRPSDYAEHLLAIATGLKEGFLLNTAAVAMARSSRLQARLIGILDGTRNRTRLTMARIALLGLVLAALIIPVAALRAGTSNPWAQRHGWAAQDVQATTLESRVGGWRNLPFSLSKEEEADARACIALAQETRNSVNSVSQFDSPETRRQLEAILDKRHGYFYGEFLLSLWHRDHGNPTEANRLMELAYDHAPVVVVQRFAFADRTQLANVAVRSFALECNRVDNGSLDPSLKLRYPNLRTDSDGCIYLPVYRTVYRTDSMASPDGCDVVWPKLGWFESSAKVALLPTATVTRRAPAASDLPPTVITTEGELTGTVTDEAGNPLAGVLLHVWSWCPGVQTHTDEHGRYTLKKLGNEPVEIRVSKNGFDPWYSATQPTGVELNMKLSRRTYFEGLVVGPDGRPVPNAEVRAFSVTKRTADGLDVNLWIDALSDANGRYRLYAMSDSYTVLVRVPNVGSVNLPGQAVADGEARPLDIHLTPGIPFRAQIVDAQTGSPVANVKVGNWRHPEIEGTSDKYGNLLIPTMDPGKFQFNISAEGYARWWSAQATEDDQRKETREGFHRNFDYLDFDITPDMKPVRIELEREVRITGVIQDPDGNPVAGATAAPAHTGTGNSLTGDTRYSVVTKKDGTFVMTLPASGSAKYNLEAHDGAYGQWRNWANGVNDPIQTKPGDVIDNVVIKLTRPVSVSGTVKDETGKPIAGREVRASAADRMENRYYDPTTQTDENGKFTLKFIRPGDHFIQAAPFWSAEESNGKNNVRVTLKEGQPGPVHVDLVATTSTQFPTVEEQIRRAIEKGRKENAIAPPFDSPNAKVSVASAKPTGASPILMTVTDTATNKPIPNAKITMGYDYVVKAFTTNQQGQATLQIDAGHRLEFWARVSAPDHVGEMVRWSAPKTAEGQPAAPLVADVSLHPGHMASGRVMDVEGNPIADAYVTFQSGDPGIVYESGVSTDKLGNWVGNFFPMDSSKITMSVVHRDYAPFKGEPIALDRRTLRPVAEVTLHFPLEFAFTVADAQTGARFVDTKRFRIIPLTTPPLDNGPFNVNDSSHTLNNGTGRGDFTFTFQSRVMWGALRIEADGYEPVTSPQITRDKDRKPVEFNAKLKRVASHAATAPATAPAATQPADAAARAAAMKADIQHFVLDIRYHGDQDKPYYNLRLSVAPVPAIEKNDGFHLYSQITERQAADIINYLCTVPSPNAITLADDPGYALTAGTHHEELGWGLPMLDRLECIGTFLDGDAGKNLTQLLQRLSGHRKEWEKAMAAEKAAENLPPAKQPDPEPKYVDFSGTVVDDISGKPVPNFSVQGGLVDENDPAKIKWGYTLQYTNSPNPTARFSSRVDWSGGWRSRIVADGYIGEPIMLKLPDGDAKEFEGIVIHLKRGRQVSGHVVAHTGKPIADAGVFVVGNPSVNLTGGKAMALEGGMHDDNKAVRVATDANGAFTVTGIAEDRHHIAVTCPAMDLWVVEVPREGGNIDDLTIRLPEPGKLIVHYDIPGAPEKADIFLQYHTWELFKDAGVSNQHYAPIVQHEEMVLNNLQPGSYVIDRTKNPGSAYREARALLDRREITIESGKTTTIDFVRKTGAPITGRIVGLDQGEVAKAQPTRVVVRVVPLKEDEWRSVGFDNITMEPGGKPIQSDFVTEQLTPGQYKVRVQIFVPETREQSFQTGIVPPAFVGEAMVTVPETGKPDPVNVELKPWVHADGI